MLVKKKQSLRREREQREEGIFKGSSAGSFGLKAQVELQKNGCGRLFLALKEDEISCKGSKK